MELKDLKTALFGFNKNDVCEYISQLNYIYEQKEKQKITIPFSEIAGYALEGVNGIQLHLKDGTIYRFKNEYTISGLKYLNIYCTITGTEMRF